MHWPNWLELESIERPSAQGVVVMPALDPATFGFKLTMKPRFVKELAEAEEYATRAKLESESTPIEKGMGCGQTEVPCTPACGTAKGRTTLNGVIGAGFPGTFKTVTLCPVEAACLQLPSAFSVVACVP